MASPFRIFRKHQKAFLAIAAVLAMIIFVFADMFTGYISQSGGSSRDTVVTTWTGGKLTVQELAMLRQRRYFISEVLANLAQIGRSRIETEGGTPIEPSFPGFILNQNVTDEAVINQVVSERVMASLAEKAGMTVSDDYINHYLTEAGFRRITDQDIRQVLVYLRRYNLRTSEELLFAGLRELLLGNLYGSSMTASIMGVEPAQKWTDWLALNNRIALEAAVLPVEFFAKEVPEPDDSQLIGFYEQFKNRVGGGFVRAWNVVLPSPQPGFREPQRVKLKYLLGDVTAWTEKLLDEVTEEEIADYYERNKRSQFVKFDTDDADEGQIDEIFLDGDRTESDTPDAVPEPDSEDGADSNAADSSTTDDETQNDEIPKQQAEPASEAVQPETQLPETKQSGSLGQQPRFRLTAFQDNDPNTGTTEEPVEESASDSPAATDEADAQAEDDDQAEEDEETEYTPLEEVADEIRRQLATDKAVAALKDTMEAAYGDLTMVYNRYGGELVAAEGTGQEPPPVPERLKNLAALAEQRGLILEETVLLSAQELNDTVVGKAIDVQSRSQSVTQLAFSELKLHEPSLAMDLDGYWYLVLKTEDVPSRVPTFEEARDQVAAAWKTNEAVKLAIEQAEQIAETAQESGSSIAVSLGESPHEIVITDLFSRYTFGVTAAEMRRGARVSDAPPLTAIGDNFMERVFNMRDDEVAALPNFDRSEVYVVKIDRRERTPKELRAAFLNEVNNSQSLQVMQSIRIQRANQNLLNQLLTRVQLDFRSLQAFIQASSSGQQDQ